MLKNVKLLSACRLHPEPDRGPGLGPLRPSGSRASCPGSKPGSLPSPTSWVTPAVQEGRVCGFFFFPLEVHHSTGGPISKQSSFRSDTRTAEWIKVWPRPTGRIPTGQRLCTVSRKGGTSPSAQGAPCAHLSTFHHSGFIASLPSVCPSSHLSFPCCLYIPLLLIRD